MCPVSLAEGLEGSCNTRYCCSLGSLQDGDKQELSSTTGILHAEGGGGITGTAMVPAESRSAD